MNVAQVWDEAADLLEAKGWCKGFYDDPFGFGHCALGALYAVTGVDVAGVRPGDRVEVDEPVEMFADWLEEQGFTAGISDWNDNQMTRDGVVGEIRAFTKWVRG